MGHTSSRVASKSTTRKSRKQLETENYRRQKQSLYVKLERMHRCFGVNMQMVLKRNGKVEIFTSEGQIVSALGLHEAQEKIYPPPATITTGSLRLRKRQAVQASATGNSEEL